MGSAFGDVERTAYGDLAVVFDLGNVLIRWDPHPAVARGRRRRRGDPVPGRRGLRLPGLEPPAGRRARWADAAADVVADATRTGHRHVAAYRDHFALSIAEPIDANVAVLRDLHAAGVPLFALTNWSDELFPHALERYDFLALFEDIVVSGAEGLAKPDPAIFERAAASGSAGPSRSACSSTTRPPTSPPRPAAGMDAIRFTDDVAAAPPAARAAGCRSRPLRGSAPLHAVVRITGRAGGSSVA